MQEKISGKTLLHDNLNRLKEQNQQLIVQAKLSFKNTYEKIAAGVSSIKSREQLLSHLERINRSPAQYTLLPEAKFAVESIQQNKKLFINYVCTEDKIIDYGILVLAWMHSNSINKNVTVVTSQEFIRNIHWSHIDGLNLLSYNNYTKIDPSSIFIVHCPHKSLLDVCCSVLYGGVKTSPHIIIGSEEVHNALIDGYLSVMKDYRLCQSRLLTSHVTVYEKTSQLQDRLKTYLDDGLSNMVVFCEIDKMKEISSVVHQHRQHPINCFEIRHNFEQYNYKPKKVNVFLAENVSMLRWVLETYAGDQEKPLQVMLDYNSSKQVQFDFNRQMYVQSTAAISSEEFSERLRLATQLKANKYLFCSREGVKNLWKSLGANDVAICILKYGLVRTKKTLYNLNIKELNELTEKTIVYLNNNAKFLTKDDLRLQLSEAIWKTLPYGLFANELLACSAVIKSSTSSNILQYLYILFAYLRNSISRLTERKVRLNEVKGDINYIHQLLIQYQTLDNFVKQQLNRNKRKTSDGSVDLEKAPSVVLKHQSSLHGDNKAHVSAKNVRFNPYFVMKWSEEYNKLAGSSAERSAVLCPGDFQIQPFYCTRPASFSKPLKKYIIDGQAKEGYYVNKLAVLGNVFPQLKHIRILKVLKNSSTDRPDEILVAEQSIVDLSLNSKKLLEFNQITTSILPQATIRSFEETHNCEIELNPEFQSLIITCQAQVRDLVEKDFQALLHQLLSSVKNQIVPRSYGVKTLQFGAGGKIMNIIKPSEGGSNSVIALRNLPFEWAEGDVIQFLEDDGAVQSVSMRRNRENEQVKDAIIECATAQDAIAVYKLYDGVEMFGNVLKVSKPTDIKNPFMKQLKQVVIKWYTHKTNKNGQILFETEEATRRAMEEITQYVNEQLSVPAEGVLALKNLEEWVDQEYMRQLYGQVGHIRQVSLRKIALPEKDNSQLLYYHLSEALGKQTIFNVSEIRTVDREIGEKEVTVFFEDLESVDRVFNYFNSKRDLLGKARTYVRRDVQCTYLGNESLMKLLKKLIEEFCKQKNIKADEIVLKLDNFDEEFYLTIESHNTALFRMITSKIDEVRRGEILKPDPEELIFTELGRKRIGELKQKFICEITILPVSKTLSVICNSSDIQAIKKEINNIAQHETTVQFRLTRKMFDAIIASENHLKQLNQTVKAELNLENSSLELTGKVSQLTHAKNFIEDLSKQINKQLVSDEKGICEICLQPFDSIPVKLMGCNHVFCKNCLVGILDNCLSNYSDFPVRCPTCSDPLAFRDIEFLADGPERYNRLRKISLNDYIGRNSDKICYCLTAGCEGIGFITPAKTVCEMCSKQYCLACKKPFHFGMTCWEASVGSEALFKMYISSNDVRQCPNRKCSAMIQKNGGCNKVFCAMCKMSICWKCMKWFPQQQKAYAHLTELHGGYFDN